MLQELKDALTVQKRRLGQKLLHSPVHPLYLKLAGSPQVREYRRYVAALERKRPPAAWFAGQIAAWNYCPRITILMATHNSNASWCEQAMRSVIEQSYPHWQLSICDDASTVDWMSPAVSELLKSDSRIHFESSAEHLGISGALNRAREAATGDYIGVLDHDDFLSPDALFQVAEPLQRTRYEVLYTDEDYVNEKGEPMRPNLKPDWSPELLSNCMYVGHLVVASSELMRDAGGFRSEYDGAQDYDLALRLTDGPVSVAHIPHILYHWRQHTGSIAHEPAAKPWANNAGRRAVDDAIRRRGSAAHAADDPNPTRYHIVWDWPADATVSIILTPGSDRARRRWADTPGVEVVSRPQEARGDYLVFLDDNVTPGNADWLPALLGMVRRPEIGVAGAKLLYPDGSLLHSGIALLDTIAYPGRRMYESDNWRWLDYTRNVTAVSSACMAVRRSVFESVGGFDGAPTSEEADVDFCLKVRRLGLEVVLEQRAVLVQEEARPKASARTFGGTDPYYSPHLRDDASLAIPH